MFIATTTKKAASLLGEGVRQHAPPENLEKMVHFKVYFNKISR